MEEKRERRKVRHKDKKTATFGFLFLFFAAIGVIFSVVGITRAIGKFAVDNSESEKIERFLTPVVMFDPAPFEDASQLDKTLLLRTSLWATLLNTDTSNYATDDLGNLIVPASDVEVYAAKLFGKSVTLQHQTLKTNSGGEQFAYDESIKSYHVPPVGESNLPTPKVIKITRSGDIYQVTVGYVPPGSSWGMFTDGKKQEPQPEKYKLYELKKDGKEYQILSLKDIKDSDLPTTSSSVPSSSSAAPVVSWDDTSSAEPPSSSAKDTTTSAGGTQPEPSEQPAEQSEPAAEEQPSEAPTE